MREEKEIEKQKKLQEKENYKAEQQARPEKLQKEKEMKAVKVKDKIIASASQK